MNPSIDDMDFDAKLDELIRLLETPTLLSDEQASRLDSLAQSLEAELEAGEAEASPPRIEGERRDRLASAMQRQAESGRRPSFGRHLDGIGPTLGMDVSRS